MFDAKAHNDWGHGTLTIGKQRNKIVLQMYPISYHGESQLLCTKFISDDDSDSEENDDTSYEDEKFEPFLSKYHKTGAI